LSDQTHRIGGLNQAISAIVFLCALMPIGIGRDERFSIFATFNSHKANFETPYPQNNFTVDQNEIE
jgi:hypothetical protein